MRKKKPARVDPKTFPLHSIRGVMRNMHNFDETTETGRAMQWLWEAHLESQARALAENPPKLVKMSRKEKKKFLRAVRELRKAAVKKGDKKGDEEQ